MRNLTKKNYIDLFTKIHKQLYSSFKILLVTPAKNKESLLYGMHYTGYACYIIKVGNEHSYARSQYVFLRLLLHAYIFFHSLFLIEVKLSSIS